MLESTEKKQQALSNGRVGIRTNASAFVVFNVLFLLRSYSHNITLVEVVPSEQMMCEVVWILRKNY